MITKAIACSAVAAFVVATAAVNANGHGSDKPHGPASLEGTWQVRITPRNCSTGEQFPQVAFDSLFTFAAGGTMTETTANPSFQAGQRSPGLGYWERTGHSSYEAVFQAFVQFTGGNYTRGNQRVELDFELLDGDHWNANLAVAFTDPAGTPISNGCAAVIGVRLP